MFGRFAAVVGCIVGSSAVVPLLVGCVPLGLVCVAWVSAMLLWWRPLVSVLPELLGPGGVAQGGVGQHNPFLRACLTFLP